jgi:hypothetical protein
MPLAVQSAPCEHRAAGALQGSRSIPPDFLAIRFQRLKRAPADFTDRQEPIKTFDAASDNLANNMMAVDARAKVIQFYGVGGIGKSRLLKELEARLNARSPDALVASVDFDDESVRTPARTLLRLRKTARSNRRSTFLKPVFYS